MQDLFQIRSKQKIKHMYHHVILIFKMSASFATQVHCACPERRNPFYFIQYQLQILKPRISSVFPLDKAMHSQEGFMAFLGCLHPILDCFRWNINSALILPHF